MGDIGGAGYVHGDQINQSGAYAVGKKVELGPQPQPPPRCKRPRRTVLLLMSNPTDTQSLRLDEEHRAIDQAIVAARHHDQIDLQSGRAPRYHDLHDLLLRHRPAVVHYAGHSSARGIAVIDEYGQAHVIHPTALEELFAIVGDSIRCVVLNACLTRDQASAIGKHVPCVVGMSRSVLDSVAIEFAAGFYRAIADGQSVAKAFWLGRNRLALRGLDTRDPVLIGTPAVAERIFITG